MSVPPKTPDPSPSRELPLHVTLSEQAEDPKARKAVPGASVRIGGKIYDFGCFTEFFGSEFTARIVEAFTRIYIQATPSTTEKRAGNLKRIFLALAKMGITSSEDTPVSRVYQKLRDGEHASISRKDMADAIESVVKRLRDTSDFYIVSTTNVLTRQNIIESASPMLQDLAREGLWPNVGPLKGIAGSRETRGNNISSLGELVREGEGKNGRGRDIQALNRERLKRLREICEDELLREESEFDRRQRMVNSSAVPSTRIRDVIQNYLEPSSRALVAAYCIVLIDTGLNPQPCDHLAADPFIGQAKFGKIALRTLSTTKNRAGYKSIDVDVIEPNNDINIYNAALSAATVVPQSKISTVKAIEIWKKISEPTRRLAQEEENPDADRLWIVRKGTTKKIILYRHSSWKDWWASLLKKYKNDAVIGGLPIQRKMIRPTVIQIRAVQTSLDAVFSARFSHHSSPALTMRRYLNRKHINDMLDQRIRTFQNRFEAILIEEDEYASEMLGIDLGVLRMRREEAVATGLGRVDKQDSQIS